MSYKIVSTVLLMIIAGSLLVILAFKVRTGESADGTGVRTARGCCPNAGGCPQTEKSTGTEGVK